MPIKLELYWITLLSISLPLTGYGADKIHLKNGNTLWGYYGTRVDTHPHPLQQGHHCERYVIQKISGQPRIAEDGFYEAINSERFMIKEGCLYPFLGKLITKNGTEIDFYAENSFNTHGQLVFMSGSMQPLPDGKYELSDGFLLIIQNHRTPKKVEYCQGKICIKDFY